MSSPATTDAPPVVVAGGAGAVGTMLVELLRADGRRVVVLDSRSGDDIRRPVRTLFRDCGRRRSSFSPCRRTSPWPWWSRCRH
nr:hypothetical protein [Gordonia paraffinivorans]